MRLLKPLFEFYINSSIHVALAVVAMTGITYLEFELPLDITLLCFIGFATITGYNFVKYYGLAKFHHRRLSNKLKAIQVFSLFCFIAMCYFLWYLNTQIHIAISVFGVITFLYAIPLLPNRLFVDKAKKLRSIGGLKIYIIALVWSGVTVILPQLNDQFELTDDILLSTSQRFLFVMLLMLPFEIRDLKYDSVKLATIPQRIGIRKTKRIGLVLGVLMLVLEFFKNTISRSHALSLALIVILTLVFLKYAKKEQVKYYSSFWVESIPIYWIILYWLFNSF